MIYGLIMAAGGVGALVSWVKAMEQGRGWSRHNRR